LRGKTSNCGSCISLISIWKCKQREGKHFSLLQDEHIIVLCFYFSCWLWNVFFVDMGIFLMKSTFVWKRMNNCSSFKINTMTWVLHSKCKNACVLFISTMICFAFWWQEWQVLDGVTVLGHFQHRDWLLDNNMSLFKFFDMLLSLSFAWYG
jgi:hypothetical protein